MCNVDMTREELTHLIEDSMEIFFQRDQQVSTKMFADILDRLEQLKSEIDSIQDSSGRHLRITQDLVNLIEQNGV